MQPARREILRHLSDAAGARGRRHAALQAFSAVAVLGGLIFVAGLVLLRLPAARPWFVLAATSVALVGAGLALGALARRRSPHATARWIAATDPALGGALADAVEFSGRIDDGQSLASGSSALAEAHVVQAAARLEGRDSGAHALAALPRLPSRAALAGLAAMALVLVIRPTRDALLHGPVAGARDVVRVTGMTATYRYPAYLGLAERTEEDAGDLEAPVGTHVTLRVRGDRPLVRGRFSPEQGGDLQMGISGSVAVGRIVVTRDGAYRVHLEGVTGEADQDPPRHAIHAVPDRAPEVRLRSPPGDVTLGAGEPLALAWSASDDHGLAEVVAVVLVQDGAAAGRSEPGTPSPPADGAPAPQMQSQSPPGGSTSAPPSPGRRLAVQTIDPPAPTRSGVREVSGDELGLRPGQEAEVWIEARDDDQVTGPKWAASRHVRVTVGSGEADRQEDDAGRKELAEHLLTTLAEQLVADPSALSGDVLLRSHERFLSRMDHAQALLSDVLTRLDREGADLAAVTALEQMRSRLEMLVRDRRREASRAPQALQQVLGPLHPAEIEELERDVLFFDMWADRRAALRASDAAHDLVEAARRLESLLARAGASHQEIAAALADLRRKQAEVEGHLDQLARAGADKELATAARSEGSLLRDQVARLERAAAGKDQPATRRSAQGVARSAAALADLVDRMARGGAMGDPELAREVERMDADLHRIARDQGDLRDRTNALRDEARKNLTPEDRKRADDLFKELLALADSAVKSEAGGEEGMARVPSIDGFFGQLEERARVEADLAEVEQQIVAGNGGSRALRERDRLAARRRALGRRDSLGLDVEHLMRNTQAVRESLGRLRQVLADRDIEGAGPPARWSHGLLEVIVHDVTGSDDSVIAKRAAPFQAAGADVSEILTKLEQLERQIDQAMRQTLTAAQRQQMDGMAREQSELLGKARKLAEQLRDAGADAPFLGDEVAGRVEQAGGHMDQAARGLQGSRPGPASEEQGEAVAGLMDAAKALSPRPGKDGSGGSQGRQPGPGAGGSQRGLGSPGEDGRDDARYGLLSREEVAIPDADAYKVPREFREEILDALRESGVPDGYEEQVREYYRRLVE